MFRSCTTSMLIAERQISTIVQFRSVDYMLEDWIVHLHSYYYLQLLARCGGGHGGRLAHYIHFTSECGEVNVEYSSSSQSQDWDCGYQVCDELRAAVLLRAGQHVCLRVQRGEYIHQRHLGPASCWHVRCVGSSSALCILNGPFRCNASSISFFLMGSFEYSCLTSDAYISFISTIKYVV